MKKSNKYAKINISEAMSFTAIPKEMEKHGYKLTPARSRFHLMKSLEKIAKAVSRKYGCPLSNEAAQTIAKAPDFQNTIAPFIQKAYGE